MIQTIISIIVSALVSLGIVSYAPVVEAPLGTGSNISFTGTLLPTRNQFWGIGTSTAEYKHLFVQDVTVSGTCTGCSAGSTADFQDAYNNSAADAQILTTTGKDIVLFLTNTDSNATVQILSGTNGEGQLQIGTADGSATTTRGVWAGYGGLGIGTTSPGGGLAVNATSTILSGPAYILDHLRTSFLIATSTQNSSFGGALDVTEEASSTFSGGIYADGLSSSQGLVISTGDALFAGVIKVSSTGTSTNLGTFQVNAGGTGTSTISNLLASGNIFSGKSVVSNGNASTTLDSGTTTQAFSCTAANFQIGLLNKDSRVIFEDECMNGQVLRYLLIADNGIDAGSDLQIDMDGLADANGEFGSSTIAVNEATTTPFYISQGKMNYCQVSFFSFASTTNSKATFGIFNGCTTNGWQQ